MERELTVEEFDRLCAGLLSELRAEMTAFDEHGAILESAQNDGKTTDLRAIEALQRAERFKGEHDVARAWLRNSTTARIWGRNGTK